MNSTVFLFSGQGAQYYQMGAELYAHDHAYRSAFDRCADIVRDQTRFDLLASVFDQPLVESTHYDNLEETNVALLAQGYATAQALLARGIQPQALLGYSLGELIAAAVAEVLTLDAAFRLAQAQAQHIVQRVTPAAMVAVLASPALLLENPQLAALGEIACINSSQHFVMSIATAKANVFLAELERQAITWSCLPVRYGFHSSLIAAAEFGYAELVDQTNLQAPKWPIYSSLLGGRLPHYDGSHFWQVARGVVRFRDTIANLWAVEPRLFIDCGPSGTLVAFVKQQLGHSANALPAMNQFGRNLETMSKIELTLAAEHTSGVLLHG